MIPGIDISHWQNDIDWQEVRRSGVRFAYNLATEYPCHVTALSVSPKMKANIHAAEQNGILWGAYHVFASHVDPIMQAQAFVEAVEQFGQLPPAVRIEQGGMKAERLNYKARLFLEEVQKITGRKAVIYTTRSFWEMVMCAEHQTFTDWAHDYSLWISQAGGMWPGPMYPWAGWRFWSYTDNGRLPGIRTRVNMMWFNGGIEDLTSADSAALNKAYGPAAGTADTVAETVMEAVVDSGQAQEEFCEKMGGISEGEIEYVDSSQTDSAQREPKEASWIDDYFFKSLANRNSPQKMSAADFSDNNYVGSPAPVESQSSSMDKSWIDTYLFKR